MENQHIDFDGTLYGVDGGFDPNYDSNRQTYNFTQTWPLPLSPGTMQHSAQHDANPPSPQHHQQPPHHHSNNTNANANTNQQNHHTHLHNQRRIDNATSSSTHSSLSATTGAISPLTTMGLSFPTAMQPMNPMLASWMNFNTTDNFNDAYSQGTMGMAADYSTTFGGQLQTSPVDFAINPQAALMNSMSMNAPFNMMSPTALDVNQTMHAAPFQMPDFQHEFPNMSSAHDFTGASNMATASASTNSPVDSWMEIRSLSSETSWVDVGHRNSFEHSPVVIFNPAQSLHPRSYSGSSDSNHSDVPTSALSFSLDEVPFPMSSPLSESNNLQLVHSPSYSHSYSYSDSCNHGHGLPMDDHEFAHNYISPNQSVSPPMARVEPLVIKQSASNSASPTSSAVSSPPARRRKSPVVATPIGAKPAKTIVKKTPAHTTKKDTTGEKRVGRRRGPLRPDQRQQAHEIRKLRACLRCKFLKKTCDKGDPCAGCQPSHARLWQVPCTRIDIKDIAYFMKDWKADYERHVSLGFSIGNIKGFSEQERPIYVTHGYGHYLPIMAREVYVRDEKCFGVDWHESINGLHFEIETAKLSAGMEGISRAMLSDYLDRHIDGGFEAFVDEYFEGTYFLTELLKTAYRFYQREKLPVIRKALKLVVAYNLTMHVTMVEGFGDEETTLGKVDDEQSKFCGKTVAPVMINFQVKCALADTWRELQKDVLEELSSLYQSVYSGDKLKNWPTIFMLAAILLAVWELIQFDCNYRVPDHSAVNKFCSDMEGTPVGVIVGLFSAISQKLPSFAEWDTRKHHHLLNSNGAVCDAMTEVRAHVTKYGIH